MNNREQDITFLSFFFPFIISRNGFLCSFIESNSCLGSGCYEYEVQMGYKLKHKTNQSVILVLNSNSIITFD